VKKQTYHVQEGRSSPGGGPAVFGAAEPALLRPGSLVDPRHIGTNPDPRILTLTSGSGSCSFRQWPSRCQQNIRFFSLIFLLITVFECPKLTGPDSALGCPKTSDPDPQH